MYFSGLLIRIHRDAGITLSCQITTLKDPNSSLAKALLPSAPISHFNVLELGTGCGMVGIAIAQTIPDSNVLLTDLPEAREIVERNINCATEAPGVSLAFMELDWDADLPDDLQSTPNRLGLVVAADCTYNPDSRYDFLPHSPNILNKLY
jgi:predicted nicotinamide N-methyase